MTCPACGATLNPSARFCPSCGSAVPPAAGGPTNEATGSTLGAPAGVDRQISDAGSFFGALFDFSFSSFVTTRIIKLLYILSIVVIGLVALGIFFGLLSRGGGGIVAAVILAPLFFLLYTIFARVWLEFIIVVFRIAEYSSEIARNTRR